MPKKRKQKASKKKPSTKRQTKRRSSTKKIGGKQEKVDGIKRTEKAERNNSTKSKLQNFNFQSGILKIKPFTSKIKSFLKKNVVKITAISLISLASFFLLASSLIFVLQANKLLWRTEIAYTKVGGLTKKEAIEKLEKESQKIKNQNLIISYNGEQKKIPIQEINITFDLEKSIDQAYKAGHSEPFFTQLFTRTKALIYQNKNPLHFDISGETFKQTLTKYFPDLEQKEKQAYLAWQPDNDILDLIPAQSGVYFDTQNIQEHISNQINTNDYKTIELTFVEQRPTDRTFVLNKKKGQLEQFVAKDLYLTINPFSFPISKEQKKSWLNLSDDEALFTNEKIQQTLNEISSQVNINPTNVELTFDNDQIKIANTGKEGQILDLAQSLKQIKTKALSETHIALAMKAQAPKANEKSLAELGITSQIARAETSFKGSSWNRIHNIKTGSMKFHGHLIKPGEEFSFLEVLGDITAENGYRESAIILPGSVVPGIGGGLCQVSTTMFQTTVNYGFRVTERWEHSFVVSFYGTPGKDAAIFSPYKNMKFINDTPGHILIQTKVTDTTLAFEFYGTNDGREVKHIGPNLSYPGNGATDAEFIVETYKNGALLYNQIFNSHYQSQANFETRM